MSTPEQLEWQWTLTSAVTRYEELRARDSLVDQGDADNWAESDDGSAFLPLDRAEALELLALGEVIARKVGYGRQLTIRTARSAGASWAQIGKALGTSRQSAWEAHARWIEAQARQHRANDYEGLDDDQVAEARALAGSPSQE
jgi:hypothetical protein